MGILNKFRKTKLFRRYHKNDDGTTAIEFAILAIPFFALVFGIIELAIVFFIGSTLEHAIATVAREIRTGEFQSTSGNADDFKSAICEAMSSVGNCENLRIDVLSAASGKFSDLSLPQSPQPCDADDDACQNQSPQLLPDSYTNTSGGDVVIVRVQYFHPLAVPSELTRLSNAPGNTRVINAITAFRNEPFS